MSTSIPLSVPSVPAGTGLRTLPVLEIVCGTVTDIEGLEAVAPEWDELAAACAERGTVFQSSAWARASSRKHGHASLRILTARQDGRLVAVAPFEVHRGLGLPKLRWLGGPLVIYGDVLALPGIDVGRWLTQAFAALAAAGEAHSVQLGNVREDARIMRFLADAAHRLGADEAPSIDLRSAGSFAGWRQKLSRSTRRSRSRRQRDLEAAGRVSFTFEPARAVPLTRLRRLFELKLTWAEANAVLSRTIGDQAFEAFVSRLVSDADARDARLSTLSLDGEPIAMELGFVCGRRYLSYLGAYDPSRADLSPGAYQLERTLAACFDEGLEIFDFLPPGDTYKRTFATGATQVASWQLPLTLRGRLEAGLTGADPIRLAKARLAQLPVPYRRPLQALMRCRPAARLTAGLSHRSCQTLVRALQIAAVGLAAWAVVAE